MSEPAAPKRHKRPGRKPLGAGEAKTARVEMRVRPAVKAAWAARARAAGLSLQSCIERRLGAPARLS